MKIKNFIINNKEYFIITGLILFINLIVFVATGLFPFGNKSISRGDMTSQICANSELVFDFFEGKSSLFYTTKTGFGENIFAYLTYFIISPFSFVLFLGGRGNVIYAINFVFVLKLLVVGIVICWFIKKHFKNLSPLLVIVFSLAYVFSGYLLLHFLFITWVDFVIYMPFLFVAFEKLLKDNKMIYLAIVMALFIYTCFALGSFTFFYLFIIYGLYIFFCVPKDKKALITGKVICAFLVAIGLSLWLLIPSFLQYLNAGRNVGLFNYINYGNFWGWEKATKIATLFTELISIFLAICYLIKCDKKDSFNKFVFCIVVMILINVIVDESIYAMVGGSAYGLCMRFGFISSFTFVFLACKYVNEIAPQHFKIQIQPANKNIKRECTIFIIAMVFVLALMIVFMYIAYNIINTAFADNFVYPVHLLAYLPIVVLTLVLLIIVYRNFIKNSLNKKFLITSFVILFSIITIFNYVLCVVPRVQDYKTEYYSNVLSVVQTHDRIKTTNGLYYNEFPLLHNKSTIFTFSSLMNNKILTLFDDLDLPYGTNVIFDSYTNVLSDTIFNNKYILSSFEIKRNYYKEIYNDGDTYLYENLLCKEGFVINEFHTSDNVIQTHQNLFESLGGQGELLTKVEPNITYENCEIINNTLTISKNNSVGKVFINYNCAPNEVLGVRLKTDNRRFFANEDFTITALPNEKLYELYEYEYGKYCLEFETDITFECFEFYVFDIQKLNDVVVNNTADVNINYSKNKFIVNANMTEAGTLMIPFIAIDGYSVTINGEKADFSNKLSTLMTFDLQSGENEIIIEFSNPYTKYIWIGALIGIVVVIIGLLISKYYSKFNQKFQNGVLIAYYVFAGLMIAYFFVFTTFVCILKLIGIL